MFKGKIYSLVLIFLSAAIYTAWFFHSPTALDYHHYKRLMSYSDASKQVPANQALVKQERYLVQKQFVFNQDHQRLQWRLNCSKSEVSLDQKGHSIEFIERLQGMLCTMQEKIVPMAQISGDRSNAVDRNYYQFVRTIQADEAIYRYKNRQLVAEHVLLNRYRVSGQQWLSDLSAHTPFMEGQARSIQLIFAKNPLFKAQGFQAVFQDWEQ